MQSLLSGGPSAATPVVRRAVPAAQLVRTCIMQSWIRVIYIKCIPCCLNLYAGSSTSSSGLWATLWSGWVKDTPKSTTCTGMYSTAVLRQEIHVSLVHRSRPYMAMLVLDLCQLPLIVWSTLWLQLVSWSSCILVNVLVSAAFHTFCLMSIFPICVHYYNTSPVFDVC